MKQTDPHFKLRLPPELKAKLELAANSGLRSMSAEMVMRLDRSFERGEILEAQGTITSDLWLKLDDILDQLKAIEARLPTTPTRPRPIKKP